MNMGQLPGAGSTGNVHAHHSRGRAGAQYGRWPSRTAQRTGACAGALPAGDPGGDGASARGLAAQGVPPNAAYSTGAPDDVLGLGLGSGARLSSPLPASEPASDAAAHPERRCDPPDDPQEPPPRWSEARDLPEPWDPPPEDEKRADSAASSSSRAGSRARRARAAAAAAAAAAAPTLHLSLCARRQSVAKVLSACCIANTTFAGASNACLACTNRHSATPMQVRFTAAETCTVFNERYMNLEKGRETGQGTPR